MHARNSFWTTVGDGGDGLTRSEGRCQSLMGCADRGRGRPSETEVMCTLKARAGQPSEMEAMGSPGARVGTIRW